MSRLGRSALAATAATAVMLLPAASAGAGPTAKASGEELVTYLTTGKLKVSKNIGYLVLCGAPAGSTCQLETESKLKGKGFKTGTIRLSGAPVGGQAVEVRLTVSKRARKAMRGAIGSAKLITKVTATNLTTGEVDEDTQTFRFKK